MVTISYVAAYTFFFLALVAFLFMKKHKRKPQENLKLPPGSMGWPYIGETLQLYSKDPNIFFASKRKRYIYTCNNFTHLFTNYEI